MGRGDVWEKGIPAEGTLMNPCMSIYPTFPYYNPKELPREENISKEEFHSGIPVRVGRTKQ